MNARGPLLLVDDEEGIRTVLSLSLADLGYSVRTAASAEEALTLFRAGGAPVVLTDIKMPGMDGLTLLDRLKALDPDVEVVLITGHGDLELAIQGIKRDATDFVTKPINDDVLEIALRRAFERRSMRQALRRHTENLERLVEEKTRRLIDAERLAAVGQTVAALAHSIKNMASGLEGSIFLLRQGRQDARADYLEQGWEMLEGNVRKLKHLSMDMLRFARPEVLTPAVCDAALPARQVVELLRPQAAASGVEITLEVEGDVGQAWLDAEAMHRCLLNLVGNALDACAQAGFGPERPGGRVAVRVARPEDGGVRYTVADNGCGMEPGELAQLFTVFHSTKKEGTGLGLATTRKSVEAHFGSITAESDPGAGSSFTIIIPSRYDNKILP